MKLYTLDPRCIPAMEKVREYYLSIPEWQKDVREGKMFGVLIYGPTNEGPAPKDPSPALPQGEGVVTTDLCPISKTLYSPPLWRGRGEGPFRLLPRGLLRYSWGQDMPTGVRAPCL